jgi:hypothetical protein
MHRFISESVLSKVAGSDRGFRALFSTSGITHEGLVYLFTEVNGSDVEKTAYDVRSGKAASVLADRLMEDIIVAALEDRFCYTKKMRGGDWWSDARYMNYLSSKFFAREVSTAFASKAMLETSSAIDRLADVCQTNGMAKSLAKFVVQTGLHTLDRLEIVGKAGTSEIAAAYGGGSETEVENAMRIMDMASGRLEHLKRT